MANKSPKERGAGGTPGGIGTFFLGVLLSLTGSYLLTNTIHVSSRFWGRRYGIGGLSISSFSVTLVFFLIGIGLIFFDYRSWPGRLLTVGSLLFMIIGVIANLELYFAPTSLYATLLIFTMLVGGIGLILRSFRSL